MAINKKRSSIPTDFRKISPYRPTHLDSNEKSFFNKKKYYKIGILSYSPFFYKYLNLNNALKCIANNNLMFVEPSRWQDKYERRFYEADYKAQETDEKNNCPFLLATCMTTTRFNEPAWKLYTYNQTGLGSTCVEFQINKHKFRKQLIEATSDNDKIYEGVVMYCSPGMIDNIHHKKIDKKGEEINNPHYEKYVKKREGVSYINNYLNLLLMKRNAFLHEKETRFFILKEENIGKDKAQQKIEDDKVFYGDIQGINIDWIDIIDKVYVNAKEGSEEYNLLADRLNEMLNKKYPNDNDLSIKEEVWNKRIKPVPYFVYGEALEKPLEIE